MTQGPPCPNCGSLLRWFPDQQQWGCDRCRVMFPPQVMVTPQLYATKKPDTPRVKRVSRGKAVRSKRPLIYGLAAVLLVGGGIASAFWMIHRGKARPPSYPDRDTAVRDANAGWLPRSTAGRAEHCDWRRDVL